MLTDREREILVHALGLDRARVSYRNRYVAAYGSSALQVCLMLVGKGAMVEFSTANGLVTFHVTDAGRAMVAGGAWLESER